MCENLNGTEAGQGRRFDARNRTSRVRRLSLSYRLIRFQVFRVVHSEVSIQCIIESVDVLKRAAAGARDNVKTERQKCEMKTGQKAGVTDIGTSCSLHTASITPTSSLSTNTEAIAD